MTGGRSTGRIARALLLLLAVSVGRAGRAAAAEPAAEDRPAPQEDRRALEARRACAAGRVEQGIELLAQIIAETGDANAVYNQARCYQGNGRAEQALTRFREYLRIAGPLLPRERQRIRRYLFELEREVEVRGSRREAFPPLPAPPAPAPALQLPAVVTETAPPVVVASGAPRMLRIAAVTTAVLGLVPLGGAVYFGLQARRIEDELEQRRATVSPEDFDRQFREGQRATTLQWVGCALGGTMFASAGVMYLLSRRAREPQGAESAAVTMAPLLSARGAGALVRGRF